MAAQCSWDFTTFQKQKQKNSYKQPHKTKKRKIEKKTFSTPKLKVYLQKKQQVLQKWLTKRFLQPPP